MDEPVLIVGLGNPGSEYENTRHNIGFQAIDLLQKEDLIMADNWRLDKKFKAEVAIGNFIKRKIILTKPQTYMNLSGFSVALLAGYYKVKTENIWVIFDEKDLSLGTFRIRDMGSSGGHNGIKSIYQSLNTQSFGRFKIGIASDLLQHMDTTDFVLSKLNKEEKAVSNKIITEKVIPAVWEALRSDLRTAQEKYGA